MHNMLASHRPCAFSLASSLAARRTVYDVVTGERLDRLNWDPVRGLEGTKEASITIAPHPEGPLHNTEPVTVNIAVANGLGGWPPPHACLAGRARLGFN